jgi:hypothetical protein
MARINHVGGLVAVALLLTTASASAANTDPDWPCIQRKVPELSLGQVWNGPELPETAKDWAKDAGVSALVEEAAARRVPLDEAQQKIRDFATSLPADQLQPRMAMLVQGLFDHMSAERSHVMSGIARYAHGQIEMAAQLRKASSDVDALREKPDADPDDVERRTEQLTFATRIYQERVQSLTYVCDVPTIIEQRLYQLNKTISEALAAKK